MIAATAPIPTAVMPPSMPIRIMSLCVTLKIAGPPMEAQSGHFEPTGA